MIRLSKPQIPESVLEDIRAILASGFLIQGERVAALEAAAGEYLGAEHVVAVSSGTAALHLALLALGIGPGDDVLVPAFTFPATANVVAVVGAHPVLVDIKLDDFCVDVEAVAAAVTPRTRAIMPVHEFGHPADMDRLLPLAERLGLAIIEDAACAFGAEVGERKVGTLGRIGCFSLHPRKAITSGEGGLIAVGDAELAGRIRALRNHGIVPTAQGMDFRFAGLNYRMTEVQAAIALAQLPGFEAMLRQRAQQAAFYAQELAGIPGLRLPAERGGARHTYQTYHVLVDAVADRDALLRAVRARGVEVNIGAQGLADLTFFRARYGARPEDYPAATVAARRGLAIPIGPHLAGEDLSLVAAVLREELAGAAVHARV